MIFACHCVRIYTFFSSLWASKRKHANSPRYADAARRCCRPHPPPPGQAHDLAQGRTPQFQRKRCAPSVCLRRQPPGDIVTVTRHRRQNSAREAHEGQGAAEDPQAGARPAEEQHARSTMLRCKQATSSRRGFARPPTPPPLPPLPPTRSPRPCSSAPTAPSAPPTTSSSTQTLSTSGAFERTSVTRHPFHAVSQHPEQAGRDAGGHGLLVRQVHNIHQVCVRQHRL
jgi:hypothetical protein